MNDAAQVAFYYNQ